MATDEVEHINHDAHHHCHADVHFFASLAKGGFVFLLVAFKNIHGERCGEGGECRTSGRICSRHESEDKEDAHHYAHLAIECHDTENFVGALIVVQAHLAHVESENGTQNEEQTHHKHLGDTAHDKAFLRLLHILAGKGALHQVLVETSHGNHHEDTSEELLPEVGALTWVVEEEDARGVAACHCRAQAGEVEVERLTHEEDAKHHRENEADALERVGPDYGFHATLEGVEEDEGDGNEHIHDEWNAQRLEHERLERYAHHIEAHGCTQNLTDEEEPCTSFVGFSAEAFFKIAVNRHEIAFEKERHQHVGNHEIAHGEAQHHLHVTKTLGCHHARNRHEGYTRDRSANHGDGYDIPGGFTAAGECCVGVAFARSKPRHHEKEDKIANDSGQYNPGSCHF